MGMTTKAYVTLRHTHLVDFWRTSAKAFNKHFCGGNPIALPDEELVYFLDIDGVGMVTVARDGDWWICEVTAGHSTGIAQSDFHEFPEDAWNDTKSQLIGMARA